MATSEDKRLARIEQSIKELILAVSNLAAKKTVNHISTLLQKQIADLQTQIDDLQSQLDAIKK